MKKHHLKMHYFLKNLKYNKPRGVCSEILKENIGNNDIYVEQLNAFGKL